MMHFSVLKPAQQEQLLARLQQGLSLLQLNLDSERCLLLLKYLDTLALWNNAYNLTAIRDVDEMLVKHILDSLAIIPHLAQGRLLDVGTGGGMPGVIVALAQPERACVLLDSNGKKIRFLKQLIADMEISNANAVQHRVEDTTVKQALGQFGVVTSRAFAALSTFIDNSFDYVAEQGAMFAMKSQIVHDELAQVEHLQQRFDYEVLPLQVPFLEEPRYLVKLQRK